VYFEFEKSKSLDTLVSTAENSLAITPTEKFEIYKLHIGADEDFNIIATESEMRYCNENK
jgi:hypothetical protein